MSDNKMNKIMNNLFDLLILSVKIGVSWLMDKWIEVKSVYFVVKESSEDIELDGIWNGGTTISKSSNQRLDNSNQDLNGESVEYIEGSITESPNDNSVMNTDGVIYDGVYDDIR